MILIKNNSWKIVNNDILKYLELNVLPNILAFGIARLFYLEKLNSTISFLYYYNSIKSLINITNEDEVLVENIMKQILKDKYYLEIISYNPLRVIHKKRVN